MKLFVYIMQMLQIFSRHLPRHLFLGFLHIPGTCTKWCLGKCWRNYVIFISNIYPSMHHADAPEIPHCPRTFIWTPGLFLPDVPHIPMTCIGFDMSVPGGIFLFRRFRCQFICAHAVDAPGIPHFPGTFTWPAGLFYQIFRTSAEHVLHLHVLLTYFILEI